MISISTNSKITMDLKTEKLRKIYYELRSLPEQRILIILKTQAIYRGKITEITYRLNSDYPPQALMIRAILTIPGRALPECERQIAFTSLEIQNIYKMSSIYKKVASLIKPHLLDSLCDLVTQYHDGDISLLPKIEPVPSEISFREIEQKNALAKREKTNTRCSCEIM